jgi:5-methylcytosine-specific restriction enzyme subunit McrC
LANTILQHSEHEKDRVLSADLRPTIASAVFNKKRENGVCFKLHKDLEGNTLLNTSYYVGLDWLDEQRTALSIKPKINSQHTEIDVLGMLWQLTKYSETANYLTELYHIKWHSPSIEISKKEDQLSPLLMIEYLMLLKEIVGKGLKKGYYRKQENLNSRIKGKVMVSATMKQNRAQGKLLDTYCSYDEHSINYPENRLLKKALEAVQVQLGTYKLNRSDYVHNLISYISPAFSGVKASDIGTEMHVKSSNAFYKEYERALPLAKTILQHLGFSVVKDGKHLIKTPPYWIDMAMLFELYVLSLLKEQFGSKVSYHVSTYGNELDYLINNEDFQMVVDAKYKSRYKSSKDHLDMRQVSGYARLSVIYRQLNKHINENIDCLVFYPSDKGYTSLKGVDLKKTNIEGYEGIYKVGICLPTVKSSEL